MFEKKVLNEGFLELRNIAGATPRLHTTEFPFDARDTDPADVARTSFDKSFEEHTKEQDERLCEYLMCHDHNTPLETLTIWLRIKAPIFVVRQFDTVRTRTKNEVSGRYVTLPNDWYIPEVVRGKHSGGNKQGSEDNLSKAVQDAFKVQLQESCKNSYWYYENALEVGVCPEQARMFLHLNHYTSFVWKQDLHNLMHFLSLRLDEHAQWEVRQYAEAVYELLKEHLPKSMEWFDSYRRKLDTKERALLLELTMYDGEADWMMSPDQVKLLKKLAKRQGLKV
jgi:thymidylate synthase (FAD)